MEKELEIIKRGVVDLVTEAELASAIADRRAKGKCLRLKLGADPTAPDIHLGHAVALRKLRAMQDLGHEVIFIIGDFTARIGDPSGRSETRPPLDSSAIESNAKTYQEQVFKILDRQKTEIVYNSEWLDRLTPDDLIRLASSYTVARMLERNDFKERFRGETPIYIHELLYPLLQGYDSVAVGSHVEIGGTDQLFNLLVGRDLQRDRGKRPQVALTMPLLEGLDGTMKMSKSLNNYVGLEDGPGDMFGKIMSIPDGLIARYFSLLTDVETSEIEGMSREMTEGGMNPRDAKAKLAATIVRQYHGEEAANAAGQEFTRIFSRGQEPTDMPVWSLADSEIAGLPAFEAVARAHREALGIALSNSDARRLIRQSAVSIDGRKIGQEEEPFSCASGATLKMGKRRFVRVDIIPGKS